MVTSFPGTRSLPSTNSVQADRGHKKPEDIIPIATGTLIMISFLEYIQYGQNPKY